MSWQAAARRKRAARNARERSGMDGKAGGGRTGGELVKAFLETMEARDLAGAKAMLAPGFAMTFPGGARFSTLEELVAWARPRYQWVRKRYDRFDEVPGAGGEGAVYCHGTLHGVWPDGTPFEGIRFIDRFTIRDGKLADQLVWNDIAEVQAKSRAGG
jgi:hypothetical protein